MLCLIIDSVVQVSFYGQIGETTLPRPAPALPPDGPDLNLTKGVKLGGADAKASKTCKCIVIQVLTSKG